MMSPLVKLRASFMRFRSKNLAKYKKETLMENISVFFEFVVIKNQDKMFASSLAKPYCHGLATSLASDVAGEEGFEPPDHRIKTCCLTAWLLPNVILLPRLLGGSPMRRLPVRSFSAGGATPQYYSNNFPAYLYSTKKCK